jgi:uncharacterized membrane protein
VISLGEIFGIFIDIVSPYHGATLDAVPKMFNCVVLRLNMPQFKPDLCDVLYSSPDQFSPTEDMYVFLYLLHPATVHFPIAFLIAASLAGLAYIHWRPLEQLRIITWWGMAGGWIALIAAIVTGLIAQGPLPPDAPYRSILNWHTTTGLILGVLYGDVLYRGWLYNTGKGRRKSLPRVSAKRQNVTEVETSGPREFLAEPRQKWLLTVELILGIGIVFISGWLGGELVYTWGVNVNLP